MGISASRRRSSVPELAAAPAGPEYSTDHVTWEDVTLGELAS